MTRTCAQLFGTSPRGNSVILNKLLIYLSDTQNKQMLREVFVQYLDLLKGYSILGGSTLF